MALSGEVKVQLTIGKKVSSTYLHCRHHCR